MRIDHLAQATGWRYARATTAGELRALLAMPGPAIVEVRTDRAANAAFHRQLGEQVGAALDRLDRLC